MSDTTGAWFHDLPRGGGSAALVTDATSDRAYEGERAQSRLPDGPSRRRRSQPAATREPAQRASIQPAATRERGYRANTAGASTLTVATDGGCRVNRSGCSRAF